VRHTSDIAGVVVRGHWLPRAELDAMLERTRKSVATASSPAP
jgi:Zn-finger nucleic acid-binding protein